MTNPIVDIEAAGGIEPSRLEKSIGLLVRPTEERGRYFVSGGDELHPVDLRDPAMPRCDCGDHLWREAVCCHILAALYYEGDERVITAVRALVQMMREEIDELTQVSRHFSIRLTPRLKRTVERELGRAPDQIHYLKSPPTQIPSVTVLAVEHGEVTGEVLGTITAGKAAPTFEPEFTLAEV